MAALVYTDLTANINFCGRELVRISEAVISQTVETTLDLTKSVAVYVIPYTNPLTTTAQITYRPYMAAALLIWTDPEFANHINDLTFESRASTVNGLLGQQRMLDQILGLVVPDVLKANINNLAGFKIQRTQFIEFQVIF